MAKRSRFPVDAQQGDLFDARALYPVETPKGVLTGSDFRVRMAQAISEACTESGKSRRRIAFEMSEILGEDISEHMINAYASAAREGHDITVTRLRALVQATAAAWLLNVATEGLGVTIMAGEDALFAQRGLILTQIEELKARERELASRMQIQPRSVKMTRGRR